MRSARAMMRELRKPLRELRNERGTVRVTVRSALKPVEVQR